MRKSLLLLLAVGCGSTADDPTFGARGTSTSSITLRWQPVDGATGYQLERVGGPSVMLAADELGYLDHVTAGSYAYRLTAIGVDSVQQAQATTSEDVAVITGDDVPIGDPINA